MSLIESFHTAHVERVARLSRRHPNAGPLVPKPRPRIIIVGAPRTPPQPPPLSIAVIRAKKIINEPLVLDCDGQVSVGRVLLVTGRHYGIRLRDLRGSTRTHMFVRPRHVAAYIAHTVYGHSFPRIGRFMSRDHSTILHACVAITKRMTTDAELAAAVATIIDELKSTERTQQSVD